MPPAISDDEDSEAGARITAHSDLLFPERKSAPKPSVTYKGIEQDGNEDRPPEEEAKRPSRFRTNVKGPTGANAGDGDEDEDEDEDEELGEDEYIVEKILTHMIDEDGTLKFRVKWEGYDSEEDLTWEPEDTLREGAYVILDAYLASQGGRDKIIENTAVVLSKKKRGRASIGSGKQPKRARKGEHPLDSSPPAGTKTMATWAPPSGSWEDHIAAIDAHKDEDGKLMVFLNWKNGKKTKHSTEVVYRRCPQKMLRFYEQHVRIVTHATPEASPSGPGA